MIRRSVFFIFLSWNLQQNSLKNNNWFVSAFLLCTIVNNKWINLPPNRIFLKFTPLIRNKNGRWVFLRNVRIKSKMNYSGWTWNYLILGSFPQSGDSTATDFPDARAAVVLVLLEGVRVKRDQAAALDSQEGAGEPSSHSGSELDCSWAFGLADDLGWSVVVEVKELDVVRHFGFGGRSDFDRWTIDS